MTGMVAHRLPGHDVLGKVWRTMICRGVDDPFGFLERSNPADRDATRGAVGEVYRRAVALSCGRRQPCWRLRHLRNRYAADGTKALVEASARPDIEATPVDQIEFVVERHRTPTGTLRWSPSLKRCTTRTGFASAIPGPRRYCGGSGSAEAVVLAIHRTRQPPLSDPQGPGRSDAPHPINRSPSAPQIS
jgi:hypothetical protein